MPKPYNSNGSSSMHGGVKLIPMTFYISVLSTDGLMFGSNVKRSMRIKDTGNYNEFAWTLSTTNSDSSSTDTSPTSGRSKGFPDITKIMHDITFMYNKSTFHNTLLNEIHTGVKNDYDLKTIYSDGTTDILTFDDIVFIVGSKVEHLRGGWIFISLKLGDKL
jgi:hypothetical protein